MEVKREEKKNQSAPHLTPHNMQVDSTSTGPSDSKLRSISGYLALPINLPSSSLIKYLLFRPYKLRRPGVQTSDSDDVDFRTLYITNLAPHCSEKDLTNLFGVCGTIESIRYEK